METRGLYGLNLVKIASAYMLASLALGLYMGVTHSFGLLSVHSHIGLLGWATMALIGVIYVAVPQCDGNRLAQVHFWLHNLGLPTMLAGLVWNEESPSSAAESVIGVGSSLVLVGLLLFVVNLYRNCRKQ
jgi:hypothetical protein